MWSNSVAKTSGTVIASKAPGSRPAPGFPPCVRDGSFVPWWQRRLTGPSPAVALLAVMPASRLSLVLGDVGSLRVREGLPRVVGVVAGASGLGGSPVRLAHDRHRVSGRRGNLGGFYPRGSWSGHHISPEVRSVLPPQSGKRRSEARTDRRAGRGPEALSALSVMRELLTPPLEDVADVDRGSGAPGQVGAEVGGGCGGMSSPASSPPRLISDELWALVEPLTLRVAPRCTAALDGHERLTGTRSRASPSCCRPASAGPSCPPNWATARAGPAGDGCANGRPPASSTGSTKPSSTSSASTARWTGHGRASTVSASGRKGGCTDRPEPHRPGQTRHQVPPARRRRRPAAQHRRLRRQPARQHARRADPGLDAGDQAGRPRPSPAPAGQAARRQGL